MAVPDEIRREIIARARDKKRRFYAYTDLRPCVFNPEQVENESGFAFSPEGAWQFIANKIEDGEPLEEKRLDIPPGEIAYVMQVDLKNGNARIYIKVQLLGNGILCRSFHYSTEPTAPGNP